MLKKLVLVFIVAFISISFCYGRVVISVEGKTLVVEFHKSCNDSISIKAFIEDYEEAISIANSDKKIKNVFFRDNEGGFFYLIRTREEIGDSKKHLSNLCSIIDGLEKHEFIKGEKISERKVLISGPKYRNTTTANGETSIYESDWEGGPFKTEYSTYSSNGYYSQTKIEYVPPKYKIEPVYESGKSIVIPGIIVFVNKVYVND